MRFPIVFAVIIQFLTYDGSSVRNARRMNESVIFSFKIFVSRNVHITRCNTPHCITIAHACLAGKNGTRGRWTLARRAVRYRTWIFAFRPLDRVRRNTRQISDISHGIRDATFVLQTRTDRTRMDEWETHIPQREYNLDRGYVGGVSLDYRSISLRSKSNWLRTLFKIY